MTDTTKPINKIELLQDIRKMIEACQDEVDTFVVSRCEKDIKKQELLNSIFEKQKTKRIETAKQLYEKYRETPTDSR